MVDYVVFVRIVQNNHLNVKSCMISLKLKQRYTLLCGITYGSVILSFSRWEWDQSSVSGGSFPAIRWRSKSLIEIYTIARTLIQCKPPPRYTNQVWIPSPGLDSHPDDFLIPGYML